MSEPDQQTQTCTHLEDVLTEENKCPLSKKAAYKTIELEGMNMLSLAVILEVTSKQNNGKKTEEMYQCFKGLLNGKCQKQNFAEILEYWHSIKSSVEKLSVSLLLN